MDQPSVALPWQSLRRPVAWYLKNLQYYAVSLKVEDMIQDVITTTKCLEIQCIVYDMLRHLSTSVPTLPFLETRVEIVVGMWT